MSLYGNYMHNFKVHDYSNEDLKDATSMMLNHLQKQFNTDTQIAKQNKLLTAFNVQTVEIIEETK